MAKRSSDSIGCSPSSLKLNVDRSGMGRAAWLDVYDGEDDGRNGTGAALASPEASYQWGTKLPCDSRLLGSTWMGGDRWYRPRLSMNESAGAV